jgi:hypothetical protein
MWNVIETKCPCCDKPLYQAYQQPIIKTKSGLWLTDCLNEDCDLYRRTKSSLEEFMAEFGDCKKS